MIQSFHWPDATALVSALVFCYSTSPQPSAKDTCLYPPSVRKNIYYFSSNENGIELVYILSKLLDCIHLRRFKKLSAKSCWRDTVSKENNVWQVIMYVTTHSVLGALYVTVLFLDFLNFSGLFTKKFKNPEPPSREKNPKLLYQHRYPALLLTH